MLPLDHDYHLKSIAQAKNNCWMCWFNIIVFGVIWKRRDLLQLYQFTSSPDSTRYNTTNWLGVYCEKLMNYRSWHEWRCEKLTKIFSTNMFIKLIVKEGLMISRNCFKASAPSLTITFCNNRLRSKSTRVTYKHVAKCTWLKIFLPWSRIQLNERRRLWNRSLE